MIKLRDKLFFIHLIFQGVLAIVLVVGFQQLEWKANRITDALDTIGGRLLKDSPSSGTVNGTGWSYTK